MPNIGDSIHVIGPDNHFFSSEMGALIPVLRTMSWFMIYIIYVRRIVEFLVGQGTFTVVGMTYVDPDKRDPDLNLVWNEESDLETFRSYYKVRFTYVFFPPLPFLTPAHP